MEKKKELRTFTNPAQNIIREKYERINRELFLSKAGKPMDERIIAKAIIDNYDKFSRDYEKAGARGKENFFEHG